MTPPRDIMLFDSTLTVLRIPVARGRRLGAPLQPLPCPADWHPRGAGDRLLIEDGEGGARLFQQHERRAGDTGTALL